MQCLTHELAQGVIGAGTFPGELVSCAVAVLPKKSHQHWEEHWGPGPHRLVYTTTGPLWRLVAVPGESRRGAEHALQYFHSKPRPMGGQPHWPGVQLTTTTIVVNTALGELSIADDGIDATRPGKLGYTTRRA